MRKLIPTSCSVAALALVAGQAAAQSSDWSYFATFYLWGAETKTSIGTAVGPVESKLSFSDALDNLDLALMGTFEARNGRWSLLADYMLTDLSIPGGPVLGGAFSGTDLDLKTQIFSGYAMYTVYEQSSTSIDIAGGFRWFSTDNTLELFSGALPGRRVTAGDDWVDPVIGARVRFPIADRWSGMVLADYGGFSSDSETWQALAAVSYEINQNWVVSGGWRYMDFDHDINGRPFTFRQSGPILGATYRF
ncbi:porin family protein [Defluviimonas sp. WL0024]|uniref:Porin family protein n=3 Tax=Albidovulum TaxID=205889 RepID=A0ABT3J4H2_9RHOB|nr:porin family protein [Defluviimonas salinarum]MCU9847921.1 porin family protein [Defluviimonas sp. WL0024]MCW3782365.1 porin family protein [Defluviimonas salinarum]